MNENELRRFDLNLLLTLKVLLDEGSVSRAAARLHVTQSAVSHALNKLREALGDELLVRSQHRMRPTARAQALVQPLAALLEDAHRLISRPRFDVSRVSGVVRIAATDYGAMLLLPALVRRLAREAPLLLLECQPWGEATLAGLDSGLIDLALGGQPPEGPMAAFSSDALFQDRLALMLDEHHPLADRRALTPQEFVAYPHAALTVTANRMVQVDERLRAEGLARRVAVTLPHYMSAPALLRDTPLLLVLPEVGGRRMLARTGTRLLPLPWPLPDYAYRAFFSPKRADDALLAWLREALREIGAGL